MGTQPDNAFERAARDHRGGSLLGEFWGFLLQTKKWWLLPVVLVLMFLGALTLISGTAAAPFLYTLF